MKECTCDLRSRVVGDGREVCNPEKALEYAKERILELEDVLAKIGDYAHANSTWPAVPDALWTVRVMAYGHF